MSGFPTAGVASPPTGAASGDLTGTYPGPTIGAGKVTPADIASQAAYTGLFNATNAAASPTVVTMAQLAALLPSRPPPLTGPAGCVSASYDRAQAATVGTIAIGASGVINVCPLIFWAGEVVTNLNFRTGTTAAVGPTNWWTGLYRASDLGKIDLSADQLTAALGANATKTLAMGAGPYTIPTSGLYLGILMIAVSTTMPTMMGTNGPSAAIGGLSPAYFGTTGSGFTTPGTAPATLAAITGVASNIYMWAT